MPVSVSYSCTLHCTLCGDGWILGIWRFVEIQRDKRQGETGERKKKDSGYTIKELIFISDIITTIIIPN